MGLIERAKRAFKLEEALKATVRQVKGRSNPNVEEKLSFTDHQFSHLLDRCQERHARVALTQACRPERLSFLTEPVTGGG